MRFTSKITKDDLSVETCEYTCNFPVTINENQAYRNTVMYWPLKGT